MEHLILCIRGLLLFSGGVTLCREKCSGVYRDATTSPETPDKSDTGLFDSQNGGSTSTHTVRGSVESM